MEELKLIMQTLAGLGETAKEGFIWWLVIDKLVPSVVLLTFIGSLVGLLAYIARRAFGGAQSDRELEREKNDAIMAIRTIRGILGVYAYPSQLMDCNVYDSNDMKTTIDAVRTVKSAANAKQEQA